MDVLPVLPIANMSFTSLFKKATDLLGFTSPGRYRPPPLDGEIIYCKNNVCVHPPAALRKEGDHFPGYLNIRSQDDEVLGSTLILTWIPNSTLQRNPRSIENSPRHPGGPPPVIAPRRSPRQEFAKPIPASTPSQSNSSVNTPNQLASPSNYVATADFKDNETISGRLVYDANSDTVHSSGTGFLNSDTTHSSDIIHSSCTVATSSSDTSFQQITQQPVKCRPSPQHKDRLLKQRTDSNRSVTSIEMDGDNLVVVTEENDDIFTDDIPDESSDCTDHRLQGMESDINTSSSRDTMDTYNASTSSSEYPSPTSEHYHRILGELQQNNQKRTVKQGSSDSDISHLDKLKESLYLKLEVNSEAQVVVEDGDSVDSGSTSGPDSQPPTPLTPPPQEDTTRSSSWSPAHDHNDSPGYASSEGGVENMSFPSNSVSYDKSRPNAGPTGRSAKDQVCGVFSVDLGQMRSLRVFYSDDACTSGQLVIASRESQYKILHFHHGGLDRLAEVFADWKFLAKPKEKRKEVDHLCEHFSVIRPYLPKEQSHPEEGAYEMVNEDTWRQHMNALGQIEDDLNLRKAIFFAGLLPTLRHEMWPFLLHYYPYTSTHEQREQLRNDRYIEYQNIRACRESMSPEEYHIFWKTVQSTVEKDVVRTDRTHPYFMGDDNPNIEILQNILLNYAVAHPHYGYTQGMSDLLAPVLVEVQNEVDAYWCFEGLMKRTIFVSSPKDVDMDRQLLYLRELLRIMQSRFYKHLQKVQDGMELLFCHRWILLCFKREFPEEDALRMWEACWAHYQTDYFHLFLCIAIISVYGEDVVQQDLPADEMLLHFSSLSMHMSGDVVLRKARAMLHQFRTRRKVPCTLEGLCKLCEPGMWDSGHVPAIVCVGDHTDQLCPHHGETQTNNTNSS